MPVALPANFSYLRMAADAIMEFNKKGAQLAVAVGCLISLGLIPPDWQSLQRHLAAFTCKRATMELNTKGEKDAQLPAWMDQPGRHPLPGWCAPGTHASVVRLQSRHQRRFKCDTSQALKRSLPACTHATIWQAPM